MPRKSARKPGKSSRASKGRIVIKRKGDLTGLGYSTKKSASLRRSALTRAKKKYGYSGVIKKVNALCVLNKNRSPSTSRIFCADKNWLKKKYSKSPVKKSKRTTKRKTPRKYTRSRR